MKGEEQEHVAVTARPTGEGGRGKNEQDGNYGSGIRGQRRDAGCGRGSRWMMGEICKAGKNQEHAGKTGSAARGESNGDVAK